MHIIVVAFRVNNDSLLTCFGSRISTRGAEMFNKFSRFACNCDRIRKCAATVSATGPDTVATSLASGTAVFSLHLCTEPHRSSHTFVLNDSPPFPLFTSVSPRLKKLVAVAFGPAPIKAFGLILLFRLVERIRGPDLPYSSFHAGAGTRSLPACAAAFFSIFAAASH